MFELFTTGFWPVRHKKVEFRNPFVINVKFTQVRATVARARERSGTGCFVAPVRATGVRGPGASIDKFIQGATRLRSIFFSAMVHLFVACPSSSLVL